ncbi:hypothetical protein TEA_018858 [Camellia sinensis var. sinensis]|uniref:Uncharacterized protein n=1 Tax=Camellia sinensis var. sinensis TaxID=542762 RepID=A0A4S4E7J2_CAMSN|nr:hypothetical protein TEA_018858 [Camellia sinensis var. sinensis]
MEENRDASKEAKVQGKLEEAIEQLTQAILLNPTSAIMYSGSFIAIVSAEVFFEECYHGDIIISEMRFSSAGFTQQSPEVPRCAETLEDNSICAKLLAGPSQSRAVLAAVDYPSRARDNFSVRSTEDSLEYSTQTKSSPECLRHRQKLFGVFRIMSTEMSNIIRRLTGIFRILAPVNRKKE